MAKITHPLTSFRKRQNPVQSQEDFGSAVDVTGMTVYRCQDTDEPSPRVGCRCRDCFRVREFGLDPRLRELAHRQPLSITQVTPSSDLVYRGVTEYLAGRMDYGALHISIIKALMELADKQFDQTMKMASLMPLPKSILGAKPWPPNLDKAEEDGT